MVTSASSGKITWDDLKNLLEKIMIGSHTVDRQDKMICKPYLALHGIVLKNLSKKCLKYKRLGIFTKEKVQYVILKMNDKDYL